MNTPTIEMDVDEAQEKLDAYRQAIKDKPELARKVDRQLAKGYRLLAKGKRLIDVNEAIRHGGVDEKNRPRLAIARAHVAKVIWRPNSLTFDWSKSGWGSGPGQTWVLPAGVLEITKLDRIEAATPMIPLPLRPFASLDNYYLLWEADWHRAPRDPYLLRPIYGSIMEIVAEWELTALELAAVNVATVR